MKESIPHKPHRTMLFRIVAVVMRLRFEYLLRSVRDTRLVVVSYAVLAGAGAIGIIGAVAYLTDLPFLFPPLGPTAFILFYTPMSRSACPKSVMLSHTMALSGGLFFLLLLSILFSDLRVLDPTEMTWPNVLAIALAMGSTCAIMICSRCVHPPAAATALLASMGFVSNATQAIGIVVAVALLVAEAMIFNRVLGGVPYPSWDFDPVRAREFAELSGSGCEVRFLGCAVDPNRSPPMIMDTTFFCRISLRNESAIATQTADLQR